MSTWIATQHQLLHSSGQYTVYRDTLGTDRWSVLRVWWTQEGVCESEVLRDWTNPCCSLDAAQALVAAVCASAEMEARLSDGHANEQLEAVR